MAITKPIPGSPNAPLGSQQESGVNAFGGVNVLKVSGLSSDITQVAAAIGVVYGGDIYVEDIVFETDGTGLATGTDLVIESNDTIGQAGLLEELVANLGANKTVNLDSASVVAQAGVVHEGKQLQIRSTVADCTGAGVWNAYILYRPCVQTAVLA